MAKGFLEVFPTLNIAEPLKELLAMAEVEKVTSARDRSSIRVYMKSTRLIHKQNIYDLERGIKDQLFPDKQITIKIQEKYRLSDQYTPEKLLKMYKENSFHSIKFSTDHGYATSLDMTVYSWKEDIENGKSIMQIEFRPIEYGKDYDIVHNPDKYVLFIDGTEIK